MKIWELDPLKSQASRDDYRFSWKAEYILYFHWKIIGWIYDNRLLLKPTEKVKEIIKNIEMQIPYPWAKPMIYVDNVDNSDYLKEIIEATYQELK